MATDISRLSAGLQQILDAAVTSGEETGCQLAFFDHGTAGGQSCRRQRDYHGYAVPGLEITPILKNGSYTTAPITSRYPEGGTATFTKPA
jgi:hypothetical protein